MRPTFAMVLLLLGAACPTRPVEQVVEAPLDVSPTAIDFGETFVGVPVTRTVSLRNPGKVERSVSLLFGAPFTGSQATLTVVGGDEVQLEVMATPTSSGAFTSTMDVDGTSLSLRVEGLEIPECRGAGPCETAQFDLTQGRCVMGVKADGVACSAPCVSDGLCTAGVCRGQAATCDDQNQCTLDACSEAAGCVHQPIACAPPDDPCQAAYCDATGGCQKAPVEDGVRCGAEDCARNTAHVCISGACVTRTRPGGELCFETLVGVAAGPGRVDGRGDEARFFRVRNATTDRWGNTFVFGGGEVRRVTPGGVVTTLVRFSGGNMPVDGIGQGVIAIPALPTTDAFGNVFVFDAYGRCVRKVTPTGVLSTVAGTCDGSGSIPDVKALAAMADGRLLVATGSGIARYLADGGVQPLHGGSGPLAESTSGELLFTSTGDAGETLVVGRSASGATRVVRGWPSSAPGATLYGVTGISPSGRVLASWDTDAGCVLGLSPTDGGLEHRGVIALPCWYSAGNVTTFTGSPVFSSWVGRDEQGYAFERGVLLERLGATGLESLAGRSEQAGRVDGLAPDARLNVTAGFGFSRNVTDPLVVWPDGTIVFADGRGAHIRGWRMDGGLSTLDAGALSVTTLQLADGGAWVKSASTRHWFDGVALSEPVALPSYDSEAFFDPQGTWLFSPQLLIRLGAQHEALGVIRGWRTLTDGPLPSTDLDGGWVDTDIDAGTGDFGFLHTPVPLSSDRVAVIDQHAIRVLSPGGIQTLAGGATAGFVDGPAGIARFNGPLGLTKAPNGDLYIADTENNAIRVLTTAGVVRTVGRLTDRPAAVAVAPNGDVFVLVRHALLRGR
ncbi:MAG: hypothetical protein Q8L14_10815 [Myxococcales bacterium]|nr:hypothetical protein [Myxococcales bacterium]